MTDPDAHRAITALSDEIANLRVFQNSRISTLEARVAWLEERATPDTETDRRDNRERLEEITAAFDREQP